MVRCPDSAEIYDPFTGAFSRTASMTICARSTYGHAPQRWQGADRRRQLPVPGGNPFQRRTLHSWSLSVPALVVTELQFDRMNAIAGTSYSFNVLGSNLTPETFFDIRFTSPESNVSDVVLNWQRGVAASHAVPVGTAPGTWTINGVRAHQIETDHTGSFIPVRATITVSPALSDSLALIRPTESRGSSHIAP